MLKTLGLRTSGGPPSRQEITLGIKHYFERIIDACTQAWPLLRTNGLLVAHAGHVGDPKLIEWSAAMVKPAIPGYSFYFGPGTFSPGQPNPVGQPGLLAALQSYDPEERRYVVAESACFGCTTVAEWVGYFEAVFSSNPYGTVEYLRYYNIEPFAKSPGAVEGLRQFLSRFARQYT